MPISNWTGYMLDLPYINSMPLLILLNMSVDNWNVFFLIYLDQLQKLEKISNFFKEILYNYFLCSFGFHCDLLELFKTK